MQRTRTISVFLSLLCLAIIGLQFASLNTANAKIIRYKAHNEIPVYSEPELNRKPVYNLSLGDEFQLSTKMKNGFWVIQYKLNGRPIRGYVLKVDLEGHEVLNASQTDEEARSNKERLSSFYVSAVKSYYTQNKRTLQTNEDSIYDLAEFSGTSVFVAMGRDFLLNENYAIRAGLVLRNMYLEGDVTQEGSPTISKFAHEQKFYGLQLGLKYNHSTWQRLALLVEFEFDRSYSQKLKVLEGPAVDDSQLKNVTHVAAAGSILYEWVFAKKWSIEPSLRYGIVLSAPAFINLTEGLLTLHYRPDQKTRELED